jgi:hypothetical protein
MADPFDSVGIHDGIPIPNLAAQEFQDNAFVVYNSGNQGHGPSPFTPDFPDSLHKPMSLTYSGAAQKA